MVDVEAIEVVETLKVDLAMSIEERGVVAVDVVVDIVVSGCVI